MKISTSATTKFLLLTVLLSAGFFLSGNKAEAATQNWAYESLAGYSNCISTGYSQQTCTDWSGAGEGGALCMAYATIPLVSPYDIWVTYDTGSGAGEGNPAVYYSQCDSSTAYYQPAANFSATDGGNTYAPGSTISVSVFAGGGGGNSFNGWDKINNGVLNFLFGDSPPNVGVSAYYGGVDVSHCEGSGSCTGTGPGFVAPTAPGTYTIGLTGCIYNSSSCANSSMTFTVACASGTSWNGSSCTTPVPTVTLNAFNPSSITVGQSSSLSFSSTNATSCSGSGLWNGNLGGTYNPGLSTGPMNTAGTYPQSITCSGPSGSATSVTRSLKVNTSTPTIIYGCMDSAATNYNASATSPTGVTCTYSSSVTWTNYCTGGNDVNGNYWQIWAYSNQTPAGSKYIAPGTVANGCVASGSGSWSTPPACSPATPVCGDVAYTTYATCSTGTPSDCTGTQPTRSCAAGATACPTPTWSTPPACSPATPVCGDAAYTTYATCSTGTPSDCTGTQPTRSCAAGVCSVTWTNYCTGGNDVNGNYWQIWSYSNETPIGWKYVEPGTVANGCVLGTPSGCGAGTLNDTCPPVIPSGCGVGTLNDTCPSGGGGLQSGCGVGTLNNTCCVSYSGTSCSATSSANSCGSTNTNYGTYSCAGSCSASTPSIPPDPAVSASISATPNRVRAPGTVTVSWITSGANSCTIYKNGAKMKDISNSSCILSNSLSDIAVTTQTTYSIFCQNATYQKTASSNIVNVVPLYQEF